MGFDNKRLFCNSCRVYSRRSKVKQITIVFACCLAGLLCILLMACGAADDEAANETKEAGSTVDEVEESLSSEGEVSALETRAQQARAADKERYQRHIDRLDAALEDNRTRQQDCSLYRENVDTIYTFGSSMHGWLLADYDEQGIFLIDWLMEGGAKGEEVCHRYRFYLFQDGSQYFTYQTDGPGVEEDIPDYLVNEDTLRCYRLDYIYDDGSDLGEKRKKEEEKWQEGFDRVISGETLEFWYTEGKLYAVDRQEETLTDVSDTKAICILAYLQLQPDRITPRLNTDETKADQIKELIPEDYCLLYDWNDVAAYDLNEDGSMDYVMALYPEDYPEENRYVDFSPYEHSSQYYAAEFWLLLSDVEQGYIPIQLTYSIEYPPEDALVLTDISFVGDGVLRLEYFIGRSPWCTAVLLFEPRMDNVNGNYFYLLRSYFRYGTTANTMQIGDKESYGELNIKSYFYGYFDYDETAWISASQTPLLDDNEMDYYSSMRFRCDNLWEEEMINSHIWERENDILEAAQKRFASKEFMIITDPIFWNSRIVSQEVELDVWHGTRLEKKEEEEPRLWRVMIPIMLDRNTGEDIYVTDFIGKEEFLELFERYAHKGGATHKSLTEEEMEQCMAILDEGWENADSLDSLTAFDWKEISLQITQQGVVVGLRTDLEYGTSALTDYQIDKEHFMDTGLWYYLAPEWMQ